MNSVWVIIYRKVSHRAALPGSGKPLLSSKPLF
jgi:hypothetical protein